MDVSCSSGSCAMRRRGSGRPWSIPRSSANGRRSNSDANLGASGAVARLTTLGAPNSQAAETTVKRADPPNALEYAWGGNDLKWTLEAVDGGTRLTLWHNIDRRFIAMGAAGWHICLDVLDRLVGGAPIGRIVGGEAMKFDWPRLNAEYSEQFGVETPPAQAVRRDQRRSASGPKFSQAPSA